MYEQENQEQYYYAEGSRTMEAQEKRKKKKEHNFAKGVGKAAAYGLAFGLVAGGVFQGVNFAASRVLTEQNDEMVTEYEQTEQSVPQVGTTAEAKPAIGQATAASGSLNSYTVSEIAGLCMSSVVAITNKSVMEVQSWFGTQQQENESAGSGIIVGQNDTELLIATNNHVVFGANELSVCFNDNVEQVYEALIKGTDASNDLAIVAVKLEDIPAEVLSGIKIAELGNSDDLVVGEQVVAIGNALGYGQSVTSGYVSALGREVNIDNMTADLIQTDAAINPGNSGGALLNMKGQVIGINSAKFASSTIEGMGYAIPISTALPILNELENRETRTRVKEGEEGYLGITCQNVSSEASQLYGIPAGVYVAETTQHGAAENAGIRKGDILIRFDGLSISSITELKSTLQYYRAGETVDIVVNRMSDGGYAEVTLSITLDANPQTNQSAAGQPDTREDQTEERYDSPFEGFLPRNGR